MDTKISTAELLCSGMNALKERLGIVEAERFITIILKEQFDYTKWQRTYFDAISDEDIRQGALEYAEEHPHTGNAKVIL